MKYAHEAGAKDFSLSHHIQTGSGAHLASYPMGNGILSPGVKRMGREADHSPPSSAEIKKEWSYISTPLHVFMKRCLIKELG
jgi:hypothetical protein